jgi:chromosome segregation ATPase
MLRRPPAFLTLTFLALLPWSSLAAGATNPDDDRLRAALRDATVQLRAAQSDLATARAAQAAAEEQNKQLAAKCDELQKQATSDHATTQHTIADLNSQLKERTAEDQKLSADLKHATTEWGRAAEAANTAEAEGERLKVEVADQRKRILSLQAKNVGLFVVANEILSRYGDFSFGNALKNKEPFVGSTRARLETLVQDYRDKILDQRDMP